MARPLQNTILGGITKLFNTTDRRDDKAVKMSADEVVQPDAAQHYDESSEMPDEIQKYWHQRYDIWSLYDQGIWMTNDAWFGVTPEPIANKIADHITQGAPKDKTVIIDAFAGAGGNAIAFARSGRWDRIFAIEKDPNVLRCGKHNAEIYGVASKIFWINGDSFEVLKTRLKSVAKDAVVFASPPWGGPAYTGDNVFDLSTMQPYSLRDLYEAYAAYVPDFVLYLPRSSDLNQIARYAPKDNNRQRLEVTHYCMNGWSKALCVFYGTWIFE